MDELSELLVLLGIGLMLLGDFDMFIGVGGRGGRKVVLPACGALMIRASAA